MKEILLHLLKKTILKLNVFYNKHSKQIVGKTDYQSLSPMDDGDKDGSYSKALDWALRNRKEKNISNIALTGPYGSGKSTILRTFQKKYKGSDLKFLNISLATFKEENQIESSKKGTKTGEGKNVQLRLIETSILQQIFYHERDKNIPDSRFKKIRSFSKIELLLISFGSFLFIISMFNILNKGFLKTLFKNYEISDYLDNIIHYSSILILLLGIVFIIYKSVRIVNSISINKLKFQNAEIGFGQNINKSILNHHIDEILYFFSVRPYNVVIIEDLDRFQQTEVFTKLREINLLLNSSEKTRKKNIVFIYAVRDDMFTDNERIKFFDFIIPVIPIINSSNSSEKLLQKRNKFKYNLSDSFIEDISFYIDDMRLLNNVTNEFYLYKEKQDKTLTQEKLFALIVYKNIYPNDFVSLSNNKGGLYAIFRSRSKYIKEILVELENQMVSLEKSIEVIEDVMLKNLEELRSLYVFKILEGLDKFKSFVVNEDEVSFEELTEEENFEYFKGNELKYKHEFYNAPYRRFDTRISPISNAFEDVEEIVDPDRSYIEREEDILNMSPKKIEVFRSKIRELRYEKSKIRSLSISELLNSNNHFDLEINEEFNRDLVDTLLRRGYIAEDYFDYLSLFHEGSISRSDYKFQISIKNRQALDFDYSLNKIKKLVPKISVFDFGTEYTLNYDLLNFLLENKTNYNEHLTLVFNKLKDESEISLKFIFRFIEVTRKLEDFIKMLCEYWVNIWTHIENASTIGEEEKRELLGFIISYANTESIVKISKNSGLKKVILKDSKILNISDNHSKIMEVIQKLLVYFEDVDFKDSPEELLEFIYENDWYRLNSKMVKSLIKKFGNFNQVNFDSSNYSAMKESKCDNLLEYIYDSIDDYIEELYLKIETNTNEDERSYLELLNNENLSFNNKKSIIDKVVTKLSDLSLVKDSNLLANLLQFNRVVSNWKNLLIFFNYSEDKISKPLITFINFTKNAKKLSGYKISKEENYKEKYSVFYKKLIQENEIIDENYDLITKSSPWWYDDLAINDLSDSKVQSLIKNGVLKPTNDALELLSENYNSLRILLLENNVKSFLKIVDQLELNTDDVENILKSYKIEDSEKNKFLNSVDENIISNNTNNLVLISEISINYKEFEISESLMKIVLLEEQVLIKNRIKLFNNNLNIHNVKFIDEFLISLGGNYAKITNRNRKAKIENNAINDELLSNLKSTSYISSYSKMLLGGLRVYHKRNIV